MDSTVRLDVRYATANNFMGAVMYESPRVFLQRPVAEALLDAHRQLKEKGYGIVIFDGYRPWYVTKIFWDATPEDKKEFVADPDSGSRHNRGAAVDLSLYDLSSGELLPVPSEYDETTERSGIDFAGGDQQSTANRDLLISTMRMHGFEPLANEWWHYDHISWRSYPIMNSSFDEIN
ncbi:MAG: M15 family metallopeptidase [Acidobacteriota bacterium]